MILYPKVYACLVPRTVCFIKKYEQMFGLSLNLGAQSYHSLVPLTNFQKTIVILLIEKRVSSLVKGFLSDKQ